MLTETKTEVVKRVEAKLIRPRSVYFLLRTETTFAAIVDFCFIISVILNGLIGVVVGWSVFRIVFVFISLNPIGEWPQLFAYWVTWLMSALLISGGFEICFIINKWVTAFKLATGFRRHRLELTVVDTTVINSRWRVAYTQPDGATSVDEVLDQLDKTERQSWDAATKIQRLNATPNGMDIDIYTNFDRDGIKIFLQNRTDVTVVDIVPNNGAVPRYFDASDDEEFMLMCGHHIILNRFDDQGRMKHRQFWEWVYSEIFALYH